jgi:hypothetical protein
MNGASAQAAARSVEWLCRNQNDDGGWSYRGRYESADRHSGPRQSWVEPTAYALLALGAVNSNSREFQRGSAYLLGLQRRDGSWPASAQTPQGHWTTSLCASVGIRFEWPEKTVRPALEWLLNAQGSEGRLLARIGRVLDPDAVEYDPRWIGWSWTPGTSSWVEPTSHAMMALAAARPLIENAGIAARLGTGARLLIDRRCRDGGWNYGNRRVRGVDLPGYAQTTALALLALSVAPSADLKESLARAKTMYAGPDCPALARIWLAFAMRNHGEPVDYEPAATPADIVAAALETLFLLGKEPA